MDKTLKTLTELIVKANHITVFSGAGISTSCGIPDFRGPDGLYEKVEEEYQLPYPEAIFDIDYFNQNPEPFYHFTQKLNIKNISPSITHLFFAWLEKCGKNIQIITQNIDTLHQKAGNQHVLECHGTYTSAHCLSCGKEYNSEQLEPHFIQGQVKYCNCRGIVKPDIIFFGEPLPYSFIHYLHHPVDTDLLIVCGTSLNVFPAAQIPLKLINQNIRSILINLDTTSYDECFDLVIHAELDNVFQIVWNKLKSEENSSILTS